MLVFCFLLGLSSNCIASASQATSSALMLVAFGASTNESPPTPAAAKDPGFKTSTRPHIASYLPPQLHPSQPASE